MERIAVIIGAGPAGLTAAYELLAKTDIKPIIYEMTDSIGGISKTVNHRGNRIDIGGHRFFSKSDRVMMWWQNIFPLQGKPSRDDLILNRKIPLAENGPDPEKEDNVMLLRGRISRIFFSRKFFDYPISLNMNTLLNLGIVNVLEIAMSYVKARVFPIREEKTLEDFFINRFGKKLYSVFFENYTEKVWGIPCSRIDPKWGKQRIKGLSISRAIQDSIRGLFVKAEDVSQKKVETSLIRQFLYPKYGPGQLWEEVANLIMKKDGEICLRHKVVGVEHRNNKVIDVRVMDGKSGETKSMTVDYLFSTMPIRDLINSFGDVPQNVKEVANGLTYRDFITVGLLLNKLKIKNKSKTKTIGGMIPDNWIYVQESDVKLARIQIYSNWSPYLVKDNSKVWIGLEYICNEGDELWSMPDEEFTKFAIDELEKIDMIEKKDALDSVVIRTPKTYPVYSGSYDNFDVLQNYLNKFENLFLIGRNGMHRYNNQDHSMLSAMVAVENTINDIKTKDNIWAVNIEEEYLEEKGNDV